jgi:hypothetical protein
MKRPFSCVSPRRALMALAAAFAVGAAALPGVASAEWQRGVNFTSYKPNAYAMPGTTTSLQRVAADGNDSVEIVTTWYTPDSTSNSIAPDSTRTPTDYSILQAMQTAHSLGLNPVLKPHVNPNDGTWRGGMRPSNPSAWFASYRSFIDHYADLAQQGGAKMLVIGDELKSMSGSAYASQWKSIIAGIRQRFSGKLTYAANYDEYQSVSFWSSLDYIGVDAYFPLSTTTDPSVSDLVSAWTSRGYIASLVKTAFAAGKPVLFTEIGYRSIPETTVHPGLWNTTSIIDQAAQANAYQAAFQAFAGRGWFAGMYWWNWPAGLPASGDNTDYLPFLKPAETVLSTWNATLGPVTSVTTG